MACQVSGKAVKCQIVDVWAAYFCAFSKHRRGFFVSGGVLVPGGMRMAADEQKHVRKGMKRSLLCDSLLIFFRNLLKHAENLRLFLDFCPFLFALCAGNDGVDKEHTS